MVSYIARFGVGIPQVVDRSRLDVDGLRSMLEATEELGFHSAWIMDQPLTTAPALEPIMTLCYAAAVTGSVRLGTAVVLTAIRQPVQLAMQLATLDQLSGGRLIVGVGLGGRADYYPAFGITASDRVARFTEGIDLLKRVWTEENVTFTGRFWQTEALSTHPKPLQRPHPPIWFGGMSKPAIDRAVRVGTGWIGAGISTVDQFKQQASLVRGALVATGRDPATFTVAKRLYVAISSDRDRSLERMRSWWNVFYGSPAMVAAAVVGDLDLCMQKINEVFDSGADLIILNPVFDVVDQMRLLAGAASAL